MGHGQNSHGQLGDGSTTDKDHFSFSKLILGAKTVATGGWHSLVLTSSGTLWSAVWNRFGQLGLGDNETRHRITFSPVLEEVQAMAAGHLHSLVLKKDRSVWAAGRNSNGQLGDGSRVDRKRFVRVRGSDGAAVRAVAVAAGGYHSMLLTKDSRVLTTGWNMYGQLGARSPTNSDRSTFQPVFYGVKAIAAGTRHSMVLTQDGGVWATGYNLHGELGDGSTITKNGFVEVISGNAEAVAAGGYHSMVLKGDGSVWCTGSNEYGQIGDGSTTTRESFVRVVTLRGGAFPPHTFGDDDFFLF